MTQLMKINKLLPGFIFLFLTGYSVAQEQPYPTSKVITGIQIDWKSHQRHAPGSDNFQLTWANDDHQYGIWGDGGGFAGINNKYRVSFGVARIEGNADNYIGYDRYGHKESAEYEAKTIGKSWGIICVAGNLYAWVHPDKKGGWGNWADHLTEARLYRSKDKGASWQPSTWAFKLEDDLTGGNILQFGRDYAGATDRYVYHYMVQPNFRMNAAGKVSELQVPGRIFLLRVPKNRMMTREAYEFFAGFKGDHPTWTKNVKDKEPVFTDKNGVGTPIGISFNPVLKRVLLSTEHSHSNAGLMGVFDSANPWGPWTTISYSTTETIFGQSVADVVPANCFFWCFPTKWISKDGRSACLVFTGAGSGKNNDSFNTVNVKFIMP